MNFDELIKSKQLTKVEKCIAEYISNNLSKVCFMKATEIASELNISDSSVIRLSRSLGYSGFPDLQRAIQKTFTEQINKTNEFSAPYKRLSELESLENELYFDCFKNSISNLQNTYEKNEHDKYYKATELLLDARNINIVGFRGSSGVAIHFGTILSHVIDGVFISTNADSQAIERMLDYDSNDCVIIFSCERYSKMARIISKMAQEKNCKLIVVTDKITSPIAYNADLVFLASVQGKSVFHSFISMYFISEVISTHLNAKLGTIPKERMKRMEDYISKVELY